MSASPHLAPPLTAKPVSFSYGPAMLHGALDLPAGMESLVIFPLVSACQRHSPRYRRIAGALQKAGLGTLMIDLLTLDEADDTPGGEIPFDITFLADRLEAATQWVESRTGDRRFPVGLFAAEIGTAAALIAAARENSVVRAIVSADGRPDLAEAALAQVTAPTLLIAGARDPALFEVNRQALDVMSAECHLEVFSNASRPLLEPLSQPHLIEASIAWFGWYLPSAAA